MLPLSDAFAALAALHPHPAEPREERVALLDGLGRFLTRPLYARHDVPGFDNSAMDGYAVRAEELAEASDASPIALRVTAESRAGGDPPAPLAPGAAARIFTGAPVPDGANAVVMQEDVNREGDSARFSAAPRLGRHIRRRGEVLRRGDEVLTPELLLGPAELALAASQGYSLLPVVARPRVGILSTGDELREIGAPSAPGTLIDSNTYGLAAAVRAAGGEPWLLPLGADSVDALASTLRTALTATDLIVSTGGVSVGDHDRVADALEAVGAETLFYKVRMKPGKPVRLARAGAIPLLGLPGNPVSALVTFELFARPLIRARLGDPRPYRPTVEVELGAPLRAPDTRDELARARLEARRPVGLAHPASSQGSGATTSLRGADLLVRLPAGAGELPAGARVRALHLVEGLGRAEPPFADGE